LDQLVKHNGYFQIIHFLYCVKVDYFCFCWFS